MTVIKIELMKNPADVNFNLIIPQGTQIVLLNEVKVLNENVIHRAGAIGKIVGTPTDAFHAYQIESPKITRIIISVSPAPNGNFSRRKRRHA